MPRTNPSPGTLEHLLANVKPVMGKMDSPCLEWQLSRQQPGGYGIVSTRPNTTHAHRLAYTLQIGEIPKGLHIVHECKNPACCNIKHLILGVPVSGEGPNVFDRGAGIKYALITNNEVRYLKDEVLDRSEQLELAEELGVPVNIIEQINQTV